jgi:hypothetical protein
VNFALPYFIMLQSLHPCFPQKQTGNGFLFDFLKMLKEGGGGSGRDGGGGRGGRGEGEGEGIPPEIA